MAHGTGTQNWYTGLVLGTVTCVMPPGPVAVAPEEVLPCLVDTHLCPKNQCFAVRFASPKPAVWPMSCGAGKKRSAYLVRQRPAESRMARVTRGREPAFCLPSETAPRGQPVDPCHAGPGTSVLPTRQDRAPRTAPSTCIPSTTKPLAFPGLGTVDTTRGPLTPSSIITAAGRPPGKAPRLPAGRGCRHGREEPGSGKHSAATTLLVWRHTQKCLRRLVGQAPHRRNRSLRECNKPPGRVLQKRSCFRPWLVRCYRDAINQCE